MKKILVILLAVCMILPAAASADYDFSAMTDDELRAVIDAARSELRARSAQETEKIYLIHDKYADIYFTGKAKDTYYGYELEVIFENKSDVEIMFSLDDVILNGWMLTGYDDIGITPAHAKSRGALCLDYKSAELSDYTQIDTVRLCGPHLVGPHIEILSRYGDIILDVGGRNWE